MCVKSSELQRSCSGPNWSVRIIMGCTRAFSDPFFSRTWTCAGTWWGTSCSRVRSGLRSDPPDLVWSYSDQSNGVVCLRLSAGGNTLLPGLPERLRSEIRRLAPTGLSEKVKVTGPRDRDFSVWRGGAVLASMPSFSSAWISQDEYDEFGPQIVFRKCF